MRTRRLLAALLLLGMAPALHALPPAKDPVRWIAKPIRPVRPGGKTNVTLNAQIDPGWHLYALEEPRGGPLPTEVALSEGDAADLIRVDESRPKLAPDATSGGNAEYFEGTAEFTLHLQILKDAKPGPQALHVLLRYQTCNDRVCLPPHTVTVEAPITVN